MEENATPVRGIRAGTNEDAMAEARRNYGHLALYRNPTKDAATALEMRRFKDLAEKAFGNLKERLSLRRTSASSKKAQRACSVRSSSRVFSYPDITKQTQENDLFVKKIPCKGFRMNSS